LLDPKPDQLLIPKKRKEKKRKYQLLIFKRSQLAHKLQGLLQPATSAAAEHSNLSLGLVHPK